MSTATLSAAHSVIQSSTTEPLGGFCLRTGPANLTPYLTPAIGFVLEVDAFLDMHYMRSYAIEGGFLRVLRLCKYASCLETCLIPGLISNPNPNPNQAPPHPGCSSERYPE